MATPHVKYPDVAAHLAALATPAVNSITPVALLELFPRLRSKHTASSYIQRERAQRRKTLRGPVIFKVKGETKL